MEQTFYVNVLFGRNKKRIFDELSKVIKQLPHYRHNDYSFQVHPFRINALSEMNGNAFKSTYNENKLKKDIKQHLMIMDDIGASNLESASKPFKNIIFVNYTTRELEPALKFGRICLYLCDFINEMNIELVTMTTPIYINFMKKAQRNTLTSINGYFMNYSILTFYDTDADRRVGDSTTLDIGEETDDDVTFILQTRLRMAHITDHKSDYNDERDDGDGSSTMNGGIILPYHPFKHSLFMSTQNAKDNINAILMSRDKHLIYYPFDQNEWLMILRNIMYEHVFLNFLHSTKLYEHEIITIHKHLYRNSASYNFKRFRRAQRRNKTHILNEIVFNYTNVFTNNSNIYGSWYNAETRFINLAQAPFATNMLCTKTPSGIFI